MDTFYDQGLQLIRLLQATYPNLADAMAGVTALGRFELYLAILTLLYWSVHKQYGRTLIYLMAFAGAITACLKGILRAPRPFWFDDTLALSEEISYGIPSGHTQLAAVFIFFLAMKLNRPAAWIAAFGYVGTMALSRVYLGMHFVQDVAAGAIIAVLLLLGYLIWENNGERKFNYRMLGQKIILVATVPFMFLVVYFGVTSLLGKPNLPQFDEMLVKTATSAAQDALAQSTALLLGAGLGFIFEINRIWFLTTGPVWKRIIRWVIGMAGALLIWRGLKFVMGETAAVDIRPLAFTLRFVRYGLLGAWVAYYAPQLFIKLNLAHRAPTAEAALTIRDTINRPLQPLPKKRKWKMFE